jgi:hypothetical protein
VKHLWEVDHPYYCNQGSYWAPGNNQPMQRHRSFADFIAEEGDAELDYNLVFRWDWIEGAGYELPEYNGDDNYRNALLLIFFMGQRKGLYRWAEVEVCRNDEPAVIEYLRPRLEHLLSLWEPLTARTASGEE